MPERARRGVVLVLVTGLVVMIGMAGTVLLQVSAFSRIRVKSAVLSAEARLAAGAGLEYAVGRLWRDSLAISDRGLAMTAANRRDDWTSRGNASPATPPSRLHNPSYARGEPWIDVAPGDGIYAPGTDGPSPGGDLDGDGHLDVASGRLRGSPSSLFFLRIRPAGAGVCINSGELGALTGDHDLDGVLNADDTSASATSGPYRTDLDGAYGDHDGDGLANGDDPDFPGPLGNGVPDWRDPAFIGNRHLVNLLDNLGAILDLSVKQTGVPYSALPGHGALGTVETSTLGILVVANRPRGGYGAVEDLKPFLSPADHARVAPFLCTQARIVPVPFPVDEPWNKDSGYARLIASPESRHEFHALVDFNGAPEEVLAATLRHLCASGSSDGMITFVDPAPPTTQFIRIGGAEGDAIANRLAQARPLHAWKDFLTALHVSAASAFEDDPFTRTTAGGLPVDEGTDPALKRRKEDLILAQAMPGGYFADPHAWRANSLEVPREAAFPPVGIDATDPRRLSKEYMAGPVNTFPFDGAGNGILDLWNGLQDLPARITTEYSLAPCREAFRVESEGSAGEGRALASADGEISLAAGSLELSGQQVFEMRSTVERPVSPAFPWRLSGGHARVEAAAPGGAGACTVPKSDMDCYHYTGFGAPQPWMVRNDRYPRATGGVTLEPVRLPKDALSVDPLTGNACLFGIPFNPDRFSVPGVPEAGTWYATPNVRQWQDNLGDPLLDPVTGSRRSPDPTGFLSLVSPATTSLPPLLHTGLSFGPSGPRFDHSPVLCTGFVWDGVTNVLPPTLVSPAGRLRDVTVAFWYPAGRQETLGGQGGTPLATKVALQYLNAGFFSDILLVDLANEGPKVSGLLPPQYPAVWWLADPALAQAGWHHIAFTFDAAGDNVSLRVEGVDAGTFAVSAPGSVPSVFRLAMTGPVDDLRVFHPGLSGPAIEALTREPRYPLSGNFTTPRFRLDPVRFPSGVAVRGLSWDGFIPAQTGGTFSFTVSGYDASGALIGTTPATPPWGGGTPPLAPASLAGCSAIEATLFLQAAPAMLPLNPPGPGGGGVPVLRDTPEIRSVTLFYGDRPRWSSLSFR